MKTPEIYGEVLNKLSLIKHDKEKLLSILDQLDHVPSPSKTEDSSEVPYEYESVIAQITEALYHGFICFLNPETSEIEQVASEGFYGFTEAEYDEQNEDMVDEFGLNYTQWKNYIRFEPFSEEDLLDRMETFIMDLRDNKLKKQLEEFTDKEELLNQFPAILERTGYTEEWNRYRRSELETYVKDQLRETVEEETDSKDDLYSLSTVNYYNRKQEQK